MYIIKYAMYTLHRKKKPEVIYHKILILSFSK